MPLTVRSASAQDWEAISELLDRHRLPLAGARDHLADFLVVVDEDRVVGVGGLEMYDEAALLRSVVVSSPGRGIGTQLVEALLGRARQAGVGSMVLLTTTAASFFPRFGFTVVARDEVPAAVHASAEFQGACPASATVMRLILRRQELT